ncbi:sensor domain-containing protein [Paenibacillus sp.]|uniref:sensor domain-containing protein n=1 Tax=Paenibacillus sp. TaxID=58172 RepID=UPI002D3D1787|nr:EAL domain-containing protein [Paenibacillus sp.]HZG88333.1 EAL domain-containing protein [Paenibacillus sp.]
MELEKTRQQHTDRGAPALFESSPDMVWWMDAEGNLLSVNTLTEELSGYKREELTQRSFGVLFPESALTFALERFVTARRGKAQSFESVMLKKNGEAVHINVSFVPITVDYNVVGVYGIAKDITTQKQAEESLLRTYTTVSNILENMSDGFIALNSGWEVQYWNRTMEQCSGRKREHVIGKRLWDVYPEWVGTHAYLMLHQAMEENVKTVYAAHNQETGKWYTCHAHPSLDGITVYVQDNTDKKLAEQQVSQLTYFEPMTGLPNKKLFLERVAEAIAQSKDGAPAAVMTMNLDRFRAVNEYVGFEQGNRLIVASAERLLETVGVHATAARLDGDNFGVLLPRADRSRALRIARRILRAFQRPLRLDDQYIFISPSIGLAVYPEDSETGPALLEFADRAMRCAKQRGGNDFQAYDESMSAGPTAKLEMALRQAIDNNELHLCYQPKVELRTGRAVGVEALLRWNHPELGLIPPGEFIPIAEQSSLIVSIGEWVLRTACAQNAAWIRAGHGPFVVSVNLSPRQFEQKHLVRTVKKALESSELPPQYLELEITESMMMDVDNAIVTLMELKALGVRISMDDFGKGYSSLNYLKRFPLHTLKIDQAFVRDCTRDDHDATIVKSIISLAHHMRLTVVAEGVETADQLSFLQGLACDEAQGYLFQRPVTAEALERWLSLQRV